MVAAYVLMVPVLAACSGLFFWAMVVLCNRRLPDQQKLRVYIFHFGAITRVRRKYKELYPHGRLALLLDLSFGGIAIAFLAAAWTIWPRS
jgi:hypothetical protein